MSWRRRRYSTWIVGGMVAIAAGPVLTGNDTPPGVSNIWIDADGGTCLDFNGNARPQGAACDVGPFEYVP